jgi:glycosyltransferase involved in cell wall biosynthesis
MSDDLAVILATYNQPAHLERVLWGYARQSRKDFQLIIADDGSGPETRELIERLQSETKLDLQHVWHEDRGFRKTEILNRALLATDAEYLIFSDGDCIPRDDFVATHARLAETGRFLSGGGVRLSQELTDRITVEDVRSGRVMDSQWLLRAGWRPGRRRLRVIRSPGVAAVLDALTPTKASWNGNNASTWRRYLFEVNGFDLEMGSGGQDRELGARLENLGLRGKSVRHRAVLLHLEHARPYRDPDVVASIRQTWKEHKQTGETWARRGLQQLDKLDQGSNP